jgi:hypothetical protein
MPKNRITLLGVRCDTEPLIKALSVNPGPSTAAIPFIEPQAIRLLPETVVMAVDTKPLQISARPLTCISFEGLLEHAESSDTKKIFDKHQR